MATTGPVVILAGAGTGKTRVISHRVAYAAATKAIDPKQALVVTFTEKAATEMRHRLQALGLPQVQASTFHAAARRQLAHFWPLVHGPDLPEVLDSKLRIIGPMARSLPGGYKFTPAKDLADEIEWAKVRRQRPETYAPEREPPVPPDVFRTLWRRYEQAKARANRIDFEDMLTFAVELYETDADALALTHRRYSWFSVDEYQDTNRLQEDLLRLWLGDRRDLCVVGDPDQTIYSFTGASSEYLATFADRYPGARVVRLGQNYRSTPQVLALANRLIPGRELRSSTTDGPIPELVPHSDGDAEAAAVVARIHKLVAEGVPLTEIAILVRTNAQLVGFEAALTGGRDRVHRPRRPLLRPARRPRRPRRTAGRCRGSPDGDRRRPMAQGARLRRVSAAGIRCRGARPPRGALDVARDGAIARGRAAGRHRCRLPRRARPSRRGRVGSRRRRRHPLDAASRQGPRVGRRLPAAARGGNAPHPPVLLRRRCARRGAPPALRRHHPRAPPPRAVVGGLARSAPRGRRVRGRRGSSPSCGRTRSRDRHRSRAQRSRPSSCPPRTSRCSRSSSSGAVSVPVPTASPPMSWPTTRRSPPSRSGDHRTRRACWRCPASVSAKWPSTARDPRDHDLR